MEGRASTFKKVLADFSARLQGAEFVAIDTELTGVDVAGEPDTFEENAEMRLEKICRIAERYTLIQVGITIVSRRGDSQEGVLACASYNLFAFPYMGPELLGREPGFFCQASALQFNAQHNVDFNKWIRDGIPYLNREDERRCMKNSQENGYNGTSAGMLQLWKALCNAKLPFVVHCPLDLFFLLAAFERRPLPKNDPRALALMIRQCTPRVYDTAHLHGAFGVFKRLALLNFFNDVKVRYDELREATNSMNVPKVEFRLEGETAARYSKPFDELTHEAGFDSLLTAQLFCYLRAISSTCVKDNGNRLFLYRSVEYVDLDRIIQMGQVGTSMFDLSRVTLLVAALDPLEGNNAANLVAAAGAQYKWMDATHILVVVRASGGAAVRKAAELAGKVHGVVAWMGFDEWKTAQVVSCNGRPSTCAPSPSPTPSPRSTPRSQTPMPLSSNGVSASAAGPASCRRAVDEEHREQRSRLAAAPGRGEDECSIPPSQVDTEDAGSCAGDASSSGSLSGDDCRWTVVQIGAAGAASAVLAASVTLMLIYARSYFTGWGILRRWRR